MKSRHAAALALVVWYLMVPAHWKELYLNQAANFLGWREVPLTPNPKLSRERTQHLKHCA
jgi:hypothetical protein